MNDLMKGWGNAWLDFAVCIALASASVLAIEALAAQNADQQTVRTVERYVGPWRGRLR